MYFDKSLIPIKYCEYMIYIIFNDYEMTISGNWVLTHRVFDADLDILTYG